VRIEGGRLLTGRPQDAERRIKIDLGKDHIRVGIVSDAHLGSQFEQLSALRHFIGYAEGRNPNPETGQIVEPVDFFVNPGDLTQGSDRMHPDQPYQVHTHGADQQADYAIQAFPKMTRKMYVINGNHDLSFLKDGGLNMARYVASQRDDMEYLGSSAAYLTVGSLKMYVIHPKGGKPYADSYRLQKVAESLPIGQKVNLLIMGHLHGFCVVQVHGITSIQVPCFQSQYEWMASGGMHPTIGGVIVDVWMASDGSVGRITPELVRYQAVGSDWDRKISRSVAQSWSSRGITVRR
jgi:predicted phosphodiesterase